MRRLRRQVRQVHGQHEDVGDALVAFALEVVLGEPQRVEAEPVHRRRELLRRVERVEQLVVAVPAAVNRRLAEAHVFDVDLARV